MMETHVAMSRQRCVETDLSLKFHDENECDMSYRFCIIIRTNVVQSGASQDVTFVSSKAKGVYLDT